MVLATSSAVCRILTIVIAGVPIFYSYKPRGSCTNCCAINERDDVGFLLYTRANPDKPYRLYVDDDQQLQSSTFQFDKPLVVFLHGFLEAATIPNRSSQVIKNGFLRYDDCNVVLVDWNPLVSAPWYVSAVRNVPIAARYTAEFLRYLIERGFPTQQIHLIGFSLGGQAAGYVGRQLKKWGITLPRITGLDPAYPLYIDGTNQRLGPEDGDFVDVIHTDAGIEGHPGPLGHVDFYPNGGRPVQPGCVRQASSDSRLLSGLVFLTALCSHQRAWMYFVESLKRPQSFPATICEPTERFSSCNTVNGVAYMGIGADKQLRGKFYLETNEAAPYGRNGNRPLKVTKAKPRTATTSIGRRPAYDISLITTPQFPKIFFHIIGGFTVA